MTKDLIEYNNNSRFFHACINQHICTWPSNSRSECGSKEAIIVAENADANAGRFLSEENHVAKLPQRGRSAINQWECMPDPAGRNHLRGSSVAQHIHYT
jgi:hypothetical protein